LYIYVIFWHNNNVRLKKGGCFMSSNNGIMSERLKEEIAKDLGVYETVKNYGWGEVSSRNCGNMVAKAIEIANRTYQS
jgi:small acid-soluble spore protein F (minor alpha/beta-type SASP)